MTQEPSRGKPPRRFTMKDIEATLSEAETLFARLNLTPQEMHGLSMAMTDMAYRQLNDRKGAFYESVCGIDNCLN